MNTSKILSEVLVTATEKIIQCKNNLICATKRAEISKDDDSLIAHLHFLTCHVGCTVAPLNQLVAINDEPQTDKIIVNCVSRPFVLRRSKFQLQQL